MLSLQGSSAETSWAGAADASRPDAARCYPHRHATLLFQSALPNAQFSTPWRDLHCHCNQAAGIITQVHSSDAATMQWHCSQAPHSVPARVCRSASPHHKPVLRQSRHIALALFSSSTVSSCTRCSAARRTASLACRRVEVSCNWCSSSMMRCWWACTWEMVMNGACVISKVLMQKHAASEGYHVEAGRGMLMPVEAENHSQ